MDTVVCELVPQRVIFALAVIEDKALRESFLEHQFDGTSGDPWLLVYRLVLRVAVVLSEAIHEDLQQRRVDVRPEEGCDGETILN